MVMGGSDPSHQAPGDEEQEHPLEEGIDAAKEAETACLEDILSELG